MGRVFALGVWEPRGRGVREEYAPLPGTGAKCGMPGRLQASPRALRAKSRPKQVWEVWEVWEAAGTLQTLSPKSLPKQVWEVWEASGRPDPKC